MAFSRIDNTGTGGAQGGTAVTLAAGTSQTVLVVNPTASAITAVVTVGTDARNVSVNSGGIEEIDFGANGTATITNVRTTHGTSATRSLADDSAREFDDYVFLLLAH